MDDVQAAAKDNERPEPAARRPLGRSLIVATAVTVLAIAVTAVIAVVNRDTRPSLDGAELLADETGEPARADASGPITMEDGNLEDLQIAGVSRVTPGVQDSFFLLANGTLVSCTAAGRAVEQAMAGGWATAGQPTAFGVAGDVVFALPTAASGSPSEGSTVLIQTYGIFDTDLDELPDLHAAFDVGALAFTGDGGVLAVNRHEAQIDALNVDGSSRRLLGLAGDDEAEVSWNAPSGRIVAIVELDDGRVAFVMGTDGDEQLFLLDGSRVVEVGTGVSDLVRGTTPNEPVAESGGELSPITTPLAPAPDGRVLTIGLAEDGHPVISAVDVDSGEVEVVADLEGVEPSIDQPVSAVAVGDDLIFLAGDRLWKKEGVFG